MPLDSGKKIIILYILNILRKYTDADHTMTQQEIADHCRCSLSSLQKMFRYAFHIGVADYVTRRRLTCCARELIATSRSVLDIAMEWG